MGPKQPLLYIHTSAEPCGDTVQVQSEMLFTQFNVLCMVSLLKSASKQHFNKSKDSTTLLTCIYLHMNTNRSISQLRSSLKTLKQPAACWASTSLSASLSSLFQTLRLCPKKKDHMMRHVKQILIYSKTRQWLEKVSMFMSEDPDPWILFSPLCGLWLEFTGSDKYLQTRFQTRRPATHFCASRSATNASQYKTYCRYALKERQCRNFPFGCRNRKFGKRCLPSKERIS